MPYQANGWSRQIDRQHEGKLQRDGGQETCVTSYVQYVCTILYMLFLFYFCTQCAYKTVS